jgi:hypothetical protein
MSGSISQQNTPPGQAWVYGPLRALLSGIGQDLTETAGVWQTRLVQALPPAGHDDPPPDSLYMVVETCLGLPARGVLVVRGERIPYSTVDPTTGEIGGIERNPFVTEVYRVGEVVALLRNFSDLDRAREALLLESAEGPFLSVLGRNYGVPRVLDVADPTYRRLVRTLAYQPGRGTRGAIDAFLYAVLYDYGRTGTGNTTEDGTVVAPVGTFTPGMRRLMVDIATDTRTRRARIRSVSDDGSILVLDPTGSPHWQAPGLADEACAFRILPWEVVEPGHRPCTVWIRIRVAPPNGEIGFAYLQGNERVVPAQNNEVQVAHAIRQVLGVWLATDTRREGTNYATTNNFNGQTITLSTPLPGLVPVLVDYGSIYAPPEAPTTGIPGAAGGRATAELMAGVFVRNPEPVMVDGVVVRRIVRYPLYLGGRLSLLGAFLDDLTVAGVIPELDVSLWT